MRVPKAANSWAGVLALAWLVLAVTGCSDAIKGTVRKQLPRPGGGLTAILTEDYGKDVYYDVYMKRDDGSAWLVFSTFDNDVRPDIRWANPGALLIQMRCGTIVRYTNQFDYRTAGGGSVFIGISGNRLCKHFGEPTPSLDGVR